MTAVSTPSTNNRLKTAMMIIGLLLLFGCNILLFAWPWLEAEPLGGVLLNEMNPAQNGRSALFMQNGDSRSWESQNLRRMPLANGLVGMNDQEQNAVARAHGFDTFTTQTLQEMTNQGTILYTITSRRLDGDGQVSQTETNYLRNSGGDFLISHYDPATDERTIWLDPLQLWSPTINQPIVSRGNVTSGVYESEVVILEVGSMEINGRSFINCVQQQITLTQTETLVINNHYCADVGLVQSQQTTATQQQHNLTLHASTEIGQLPAGQNHLLPMPLSDPTAHPSAITEGQLRHFIDLNITGPGENSIAPLYVPAQPPLLLVAQIDGPLEAYHAETGELQWTFATGRTIFGQPVFDERNGRIYFGASDKKLYALDYNGLFHWAITTADNVVTRPLLYDDRLLFGSEDGHIYCVDQQSGVIINRVATNGAIVSSPAQSGETAVIGSDDGGVYAIDLTNCVQKWLFDAGEAVEAGILIDNDVVYVTGRGQLAALQLESGDPIWTQEPEEVYRFAPALLDGTLYLVDEFKKLSAFDVANGRLLWTLGDEIYIGTPLVAGNQLLVSTDGAGIHLLDTSGNTVQVWNSVENPPPDLALDYAFIFGPQVGGNSYWLVDSVGQVIQLTPTDG